MNFTEITNARTNHGLYPHSNIDIVPQARQYCGDIIQQQRYLATTSGRKYATPQQLRMSIIPTFGLYRVIPGDYALGLRGTSQIPLRYLVRSLSATSFEPASVVEFGFTEAANKYRIGKQRERMRSGRKEKGWW